MQDEERGKAKEALEVGEKTETGGESKAAESSRGCLIGRSEEGTSHAETATL